MEANSNNVAGHFSRPFLPPPANLINFLPSQLGLTTQTPLPHTGDPRKLFLSDLWLCVSQVKHLIGVFRPWRHGKYANKWDEFYPSYVNIKSIVLHAILVVLQLFFILSLPFFLITPVVWMATWMAGFFLITKILCNMLNGQNPTLEPSDNVLQTLEGRGDKAHSDEFWIYLNGVSVGKDWLQSNIDRMSLTFGRHVHGVLNPTSGIIFDLLQCLVQRNMYYATNDIRQAYVQIKNALNAPGITKVVFILHSQGGIEGGIIIDWLLAEMPQPLMNKLEVYTFGNAANHFNNPQRIGSDGKLTAKAIGHIEHYANNGDFVAGIGVLHYAQGSSAIRNRFMGRVFISPNSGHLLNQHYLYAMFPLTDDDICRDNNEFMDATVNSLETSVKSGRESTEDEVGVRKDSDSPISPSVAHNPPRRVRDVSRLWAYRNGAAPAA